MDANKTIIFTAGAPGAGKGYIIARDYAGLTVVDCDKHKQAHPDYDPKNPAALPAWSSEQATKEFFSMLAGDDSFVFDGTGVVPPPRAGQWFGWEITRPGARPSMAPPQ